MSGILLVVASIFYKPVKFCKQCGAKLEKDQYKCHLCGKQTKFAPVE
jgi:predicted amidophosphoribosyltransferase